MAKQKQKGGDFTTVRIARKPKERLAKVARHRAVNEDREVTDTELVSEAVELFCEREEKKLGIA